MPKAKSLSDFNRNQTALIDKFSKAKEPLYLTGNGCNSVVVMDSDACDELASFRNELRIQEMRIHNGIMHGYEDYLSGKTIPAAEANAHIREENEWL